MKFLVVSQQHELLPFANRLMNEDHEVDVIVWKRRYEKSWAGRLSLAARNSEGRISPDLWKYYKDEGWCLITNSQTTSSRFGEGYGVLPGIELNNNLRIGGWSSDQAVDEGLHMVVVDRGAWTGNQGPSVDSAIFLLRLLPEVRNELIEQAMKQVEKVLQHNGFRGLWQADFNLTMEGAHLSGIQMGWPMLQTHAFFSEQNMGDVLTGAPAALPERVTGAVALSVPPWPNSQGGSSEPQPVGGLTPIQMGKIWWHDVVISPEDKELRVAGLDGLLGISTGAAHSPGLARARALEALLRIEMPEKQYRVDAGAQLDTTLGALEERFDLKVL